MSDDEGVMPFQAACEAAPARVTPALGKGLWVLGGHDGGHAARL